MTISTVKDNSINKDMQKHETTLMIYGNNSPFLAQFNPKSDKHKAKDNDLKKCNTNYVTITIYVKGELINMT